MNRHNALLYPLRQISVHSESLLHRGVASSKPKKFNTKKLLSCLYDLMGLPFEEKVQNLTFMVGAGVETVGNDFSALSERGVFVEKQSVSIENFIGWINSLGESEACVVLGEEKSSIDQHTKRSDFVSSFFRSNVDRDEFHREINKQSSVIKNIEFDSDEDTAPIILQERPGKLSPLRLREVTKNHFDKEWSRKFLSQKTDGCFEGWGVGTLLVSNDPDKYNRTIEIAAQINSYSFAQMDLSWARELVGQWKSWFQDDLSRDIEKLDAIVLSTSSYYLAAKVLEAIRTHDDLGDIQVVFPDFRYGYNSTLSAMSLLRSENLSLGYIGVASVDRSVFLASWS